MQIQFNFVELHYLSHCIVSEFIVRFLFCYFNEAHGIICHIIYCLLITDLLHGINKPKMKEISVTSLVYQLSPIL